MKTLYPDYLHTEYENSFPSTQAPSDANSEFQHGIYGESAHLGLMVGAMVAPVTAVTHSESEKSSVLFSLNV